MHGSKQITRCVCACDATKGNTALVELSSRVIMNRYRVSWGNSELGILINSTFSVRGIILSIFTAACVQDEGLRRRLTGGQGVQ